MPSGAKIDLKSHTMDDKNKQLEVAIAPEVAGGTYANLAIISHSSAEFIIDFASMLPGTPKANVRSRIVMTPDHAKRLLAALNENIAKYEQQFGTIDLGNGNTFVPPMPMFGGGQA